MASQVIDVHTHMLHERWLDLLKKHGKPRYAVKEVLGGLQAIHLDDAPFMTPVPEMFDYPLRIRNMDKARIDLAVLSLTCPNVYWGDEEVSVQAARIMNESMAAAQAVHEGRLRWLASLPWQYPKLAVEELKRARESGAVGVMVLANIDGKALTDPGFAPIWSEIDRHALPVLVHPTAPPGVERMGMHEFQLTASIGFKFEANM